MAARDGAPRRQNLACRITRVAQRIGEIVAGKRAITADTDLRLQADYDTEVAKAALVKTLAKIKPWQEATEHAADMH